MGNSPIFTNLIAYTYITNSFKEITSKIRIYFVLSEKHNISKTGLGKSSA